MTIKRLFNLLKDKSGVTAIEYVSWSQEIGQLFKVYSTG